MSHFETLSSLTHATTPAVSITPSHTHASVPPTISTAAIDETLSQLIISTLSITSDMLVLHSNQIPTLASYFGDV